MARLVLLAAALACVSAQGIGKPCFANETAMEIYADVDLSGKVAVITGVDKGIGLEIGKALAARGATIVPACRKQQEMTDTVEAIKKDVRNAKVEIPPALMDLSSFQSVRDFAKSLQKYRTIDFLVNDAGMANNPHQTVTQDGYEMAFQIDFPSQVLLTNLLMPQIRAAKGRVVNLASKAYRMACPMAKRWQCMQLDRLPPPVITGSQKVPVMNIPASNYGIARLLMIRWTEELARHEAEAGSGVVAISVNPGFVNTSMADSKNLSPFFQKLACQQEGRPGAPCPTSPAQGALTPTFLALAPFSNIEAGKFYEWCQVVELKQCLDIFDGPIIPTQCSGGDQKYKEGLWKLTEQWLANWTAPLNEPKQDLVVTDEDLLSGACPKWLGSICDAWGCAFGCLKELGACIKDRECKSSLTKAISCSAKMQAQGKTANEQLACFVPVNTLRDNVFYCLLDEHNCIHPAKDKTPYPVCRDDQMAGDSKYLSSHVLGDWWKVRAWTKGEMYECRPCGRVSFTPYRTLPWPIKAPADTSGYATIASSWYEKDENNKSWIVNETSLFGPRDGKVGYPTKMNHRGVMYGLSYLENFTVVHDGTSESEPFLFLYGCGSTIQGAYVTGFVMAKTPTASPSLAKRIADIAKNSGFDEGDAWCEVDNSCAQSEISNAPIVI